MIKAHQYIMTALLLAIVFNTNAQEDDSFCDSVEFLLEEMYSGFEHIKGDLYAGYGADEYMATKKLEGAIEARIREGDTPVLQNIFIENEEDKDVAFAKYNELLEKLKACKPGSWEEKDKTKVQDRDKKSYQFYSKSGELTSEIVITVWKQFNGYTLSIRLSQR